MERAGTVLLPLLLLLSARSDEAQRLAAAGPRKPEPFACTQPSLVGTRPMKLRGSMSDAVAAPWAVIAARSDATPQSYDDLTRHLASHGCAAFVVERTKDEPWWKYAETLGAAIWQVRAQLETEGSPFRGRIDGARLLLIGDGGGAAAAARVAAEVSGLRGLVLLDPGEPGAALPWLAQLRSPFLAIATAAPESAAAERWFDATGSEAGERWVVEFQTERPLAASPEATGTQLRRDVRAVVAAFAAVELDLDARVPPSFPELVRRGQVDRKVIGGAATLPLAIQGAPGRH